MALGLFLSKLLAAAAAADKSVGIEEPKFPKSPGNVAMKKEQIKRKVLLLQRLCVIYEFEH